MTNENIALVTVGDPALTLADRKLAGSADCLNCGTGLNGPFCYYCGQPDRNLLRFFPALVRDLLEDFLDLDSRFMRTMKPLLFKPGRLTRDYMTGRRFRYTPPMRLYIFASILFFLLAALLSGNAIDTNKGGTGHEDVAQVGPGDETHQQLLEESLTELPPDLREKVQSGLAEHESVSANAADENDGFKLDTDGFQFNDEPWDRDTNPVDIRWLPDWINKRINDEIEGSPRKAEQINENPNLIVEQVFDILPATMFILLPVVALILKCWYLFAKRYYVEHLIFSLHNHSFLFVSLILLLLTNLVGDLFNQSGYTIATTGTEWLTIAISVWIPVYFLISLRVVYQQGWFMTVAKFSLIGISYLILLIAATTFVALASFVLL